MEASDDCRNLLDMTNTMNGADGIIARRTELRRRRAAELQLIIPLTISCWRTPEVQNHHLPHPRTAADGASR